jgi:hypothetical protein
MRTPACFIVAATLLGTPAEAHQCDVLGKSPDTELWFIRQHPDVRLFCARCGDATPTRFVVARARAAPGGKDWPPRVDLTDAAGHTRRVDVASVFVRLDPAKAEYTNVANRAVCARWHTPHTIAAR